MATTRGPQWAGIDWVDKELVELQDEISRHPDLIQKIQAEGHETFSAVLGALAAELNIALHGAYTAGDLRLLCGVLKDRLQKRRSPIIYR